MKPELTHARLLELLHYDPDFGEFRNRVRRGMTGRAGAVSGNARHSGGYRQMQVDGVVYLCHRLAWFYMTGGWPPPGLEIDHINRDRTDNRWSNLRVVTRSFNSSNRAPYRQRRSWSRRSRACDGVCL